MLRCIGGGFPSDGSGRYIKCVVVGDGRTGKTCLPISYAENTFSSDYVPTVCCNIIWINVVDGNSVNLNLWDIAGEENDNKLRPLSYRGADVFLVVFSLINKVSYENVQKQWVPELRRYAGDIPIVLVGTMLDMREDKQFVLNHPDLETVSTAQGKELKTLIGAVAYIECSAKTQQNLEAVFESVIKAALTKPKFRKKKTWKQNRCSIM